MNKSFWTRFLRLRLWCDLVTPPPHHRRQGDHPLNRHRPAAGSRAKGHHRALHDASIAALSVGSGLGVHFAGSSAPFVASAGVLAAALVSRYSYGAEIETLRLDLQDVQSQLSALAEQLQADRAGGTQRLSWVANVSHEIRSPLSAVVALGDMLQDTPLAPEQKALVKDIQEAGHIVLGVVNDTLDLAKVESGRLMLVSRPFNLQALCERVARLGQALASGKHRPLQVRVGDVPLDAVVGDELRLQQVLLNLISNAVKYSGSGVVDVACRPLEEVSGRTVLLRFSVRDQGPGMTPQERDALFTAYTRLRGDDLGDEGGTGLGLHLCQQIVQHMGGTIGVISEPGQGSEFWFTVPLELDLRVASTPRAEVGLAQMQIAANGRSLEGRLIAVVDDARMSREVARRIIHAEGGTCLAFDSAEGLLNQLRASERPALDAVLMDLELSGMNGFAACEQLRALEGMDRVPVIAVSGTEAAEIAENLKRSGLAGHVLKPFHASALVSAIVPLLD